MNSKNKAEQRSASLLRVPKAKNRLGLKVPAIPLPHEDLIQAEKEVELPSLELSPEMTSELSSLSSPSTQTRQTTQTSPARQTTQTRQTIDFEQKTEAGEIAPSKNYQKVPNSITKLAIPEGLFVGKSKQLYDVLYGLTRGNIIPKRSIRISKTKIMKQSGIGSRITFDACITRLQTVGLLRITILIGEHEGNEFEVYLPEEVPSLTTLTRQSSQSSQSSQTSPAQKLDSLVSLETSQTRHSLNVVNTTTSADPKTFFKNNYDIDDETTAFSQMIEAFGNASERLTGRRPSVKEVGKWRILAELLILELDIAARRAGTISSVPAFLTEVLRRRLMNRANQSKIEKRIPDTVGKDANPEYEGVVALDEQGREETLAQLQEFAKDDFLGEFKKWYTDEDWEWLIKNLKA